MDKTTLKNIELNLSDKLQNYLGDLLKALAVAPEITPGDVVTLEKTDGHDKQGHSEAGTEQKAVVPEEVRAESEKSTVLHEVHQGQQYEAFLTQGQRKGRPRMDRLLSILDEVAGTAKALGTRAPVVAPPIQTAPVSVSIHDEITQGNIVIEETEEEEGGQGSQESTDDSGEEEAGDDETVSINETNPDRKRTTFLKV